MKLSRYFRRLKRQQKFPTKTQGVVLSSVECNLLNTRGIQADKTWKERSKKRKWTLMTSKKGSLQSISRGKGCSLPHTQQWFPLKEARGLEKSNYILNIWRDHESQWGRITANRAGVNSSQATIRGGLLWKHSYRQVATVENKAAHWGLHRYTDRLSQAQGNAV